MNITSTQEIKNNSSVHLTGLSSEQITSLQKAENSLEQFQSLLHWFISENKKYDQMHTN